jgi:hypothetical protein
MCPKKPKKEKENLGQKTTGNSAHMAVDELQPTKEHEVSKMFMAIDLFQLQTGLLLDCAATCHMFSRHSAFNLYKEVSNKFISVGELHKLPVKGCGSV